MPTYQSITERANRVGDRWPRMTSAERLRVVDIADEIRRHAQRHQAELAAVLATEPETDGPPIDRPAWCTRSKTRVQGIYDYMRAHDDKWLTMQAIAEALNMNYQTLKYSFSQMKHRGYVVRGPDLPRPKRRGGSPLHQYRLARKSAKSTVSPKEPIAA